MTHNSTVHAYRVLCAAVAKTQLCRAQAIRKVDMRLSPERHPGHAQKCTAISELQTQLPGHMVSQQMP